MITVDLRGDLSVALRAVDSLDAAVKGRATARALNRAATTVRADARKEIRKRWNVAASRVNKIIQIRQASSGRLEALVYAKDRRLALSAFGANKGKKGNVTVKVLRGGARRQVKGNPNLPGKPFVAELRTGHVGIFQRTSANRPYGRPTMKELFSVSIPSGLVNRKISEILRRVAARRFNEELARELRFRAGRSSGG